MSNERIKELNDTIAKEKGMINNITQKITEFQEATVKLSNERLMRMGRITVYEEELKKISDEKEVDKTKKDKTKKE